MSKFGHKLVFNTEGMASCPESGENYQLNENNLLIIP
jgi:hypothetical protein